MLLLPCLGALGACLEVTLLAAEGVARKLLVPEMGRGICTRDAGREMVQGSFWILIRGAGQWLSKAAVLMKQNKRSADSK